MVKKYNWLYFLFLLPGMLLWLKSFFGDGQLDLTLHDLYLSIDYAHIGIAFMILSVFYALVYFLLRKQTIFALIILHIVLMVPFFQWLESELPRMLSMSGVPRRYYTHTPQVFDSWNLFEDPLTFSLCMLMAGQLVFLFNVLWALIRIIKGRKQNAGTA